MRREGTEPNKHYFRGKITVKMNRAECCCNVKDWIQLDGFKVKFSDGFYFMMIAVECCNLN
jgi:hypothetical protein